MRSVTNTISAVGDSEAADAYALKALSLLLQRLLLTLRTTANEEDKRSKRKKDGSTLQDVSEKINELNNVRSACYAALKLASRWLESPIPGFAEELKRKEDEVRDCIFFALIFCLYSRLNDEGANGNGNGRS